LFQLLFTQAKEVENLGKKMAATNKTLQTRDTKIIELEQQLEDANRSPVFFKSIRRLHFGRAANVSLK
jgi:hypothetical protein